MSARVFKSLQVRITLAIVLLILGGLAALAAFVASRQEERLTELLSGQQLATVGYVAEDIDAKIRLRVDSLTRIALHLREVSLSDAQRLEAFLAERQTIYDLFQIGLIVVKPDLSGAYSDFPALPGRRTSHFRLSPFADVARERVPVVGPPGIGRHTNQPVVVIAVPVKDKEGKLLAILGGVTSLDANNFLDLVSKQRLGRASDFLVVAPRHGVVVTGTGGNDALKSLPPDGEDALLDRIVAVGEGTLVGIDARGVEHLASARKVPATGWLVIAKMPTSEAFAPVREFNRLAYGIAAILALFIGLVAAVFLRRALAPLSRAAASLDDMTRAHGPLRALPMEREDEVGQLVDSFNRLQQSLNRERDALRESQAKLRGLIEAMPDSVQFKDQESHWLEYNASAQSAFGLDGIDCYAKTDRQLAELASPAARRALLQCHVTDEIAWRTGELCRVDEVVPQPDGGSKVFDVIKVPLFDDLGRPKGVVVIGRDITDIRHAAEALKRSLAEFNHLVERIPVGVYKFRMCADGSERFEYVSPRWCQLAGVTAEEAYHNSESAYRRIHPDDCAAMRQRNQLARVNLEPFEWEGRMLDDMGNQRWIHIESTPTVMSNGDVVWEGIQYDITERRQAEENLHLVASVFQYAREGICITDASERIIDVNPTFCEMSGFGRDEVIGKTPRILRSGHHGRQFYIAMWDAIRTRGFWRGEIWNRHREGGLRVQLLTISAVHTEAGEVSHYLGVFSDITQMKENEKQLERLAHYDALTGIPNRLLLADRLAQAIAHARRNGTVLAVCLLDLDDFKQVNDSFGHEAGDRLLVEVARRLQVSVRTGDTVARLGGDEFVFLMPGLYQTVECEAIIDRLIADLTESYSISGRSVNIVASVGVAVFPRDGIEAETLMRHADEAMYAAKHAGGHCYKFYDPADRKKD
jgi:diguanylate cyclase (GGDEF)-like protein/PAS domain S-box-containing protein